MNNGGIARIKYYKGQLLTARDFADQQKYHRDHLRQFLQRFPFGVVAGLDVIIDKDSTGKDALIIKAGIAVDRPGNQLVIPTDVFVPFDEVPSDQNLRYLSLKYEETEFLVEPSLFTPNNKNNRVKESAIYEWKDAPNFFDKDVSYITLAKVLGDKAPFTLDKDEDEIGRTIRVEARIVDTAQILDGAVTNRKLADNAVTSDKILDGEVKENDLADGAVTTNKLEKTDNSKKIQTINIANDAVDTDQLAGEAVTTNKLEKTDNSKKIQTINIADDAVTGDQLQGNDNEDSKRAVDTKHIKDNAVHSAKIAEADNAKDANNIVIQDPKSGAGVKTKHITDDAVASAKIAEADNAKDANNVVIQDPNSGTGVKTKHITDDAVASAKIAEADNAKDANNVVIQDPNSGAGVKTKHITDDAVASAKIAEADNAKDANNVVIQDPNSGTGVKTRHITDDAVASAKIAEADNTKDANNVVIQDPNSGTGVKTRHITNGAVTSHKLSVLDPAIIEESFGSEDPALDKRNVSFSVDFDGKEFDKVRIPHIIPTTKDFVLTWQYRIEYRVEMPENQPEIHILTYNFTITKVKVGVCGYKVRFVKVN